jgi:hypothetical protein
VVKRGGGGEGGGGTCGMTSMACHVQIPSNGPCLIGRLGRINPFFVAGGGEGQVPPSQQQHQQCDNASRNNHPNFNTTMLSVYCIQSFLDAQQVDRIHWSTMNALQILT